MGVCVCVSSVILEVTSLPLQFAVWSQGLRIDLSTLLRHNSYNHRLIYHPARAPTDTSETQKQTQPFHFDWLPKGLSRVTEKKGFELLELSFVAVNRLAQGSRG